MAIAFDNAVDGGNATTTLSYSHTITGVNNLLVIGILTTDAATSVISVMYGSQTATLVDSQAGTGSEITYMYQLQNATAGAHNIVITVTTGKSVFGWSSSYSGVAVSGGFDSKNKGTTSGTIFTLSTTVVASNCWLFIVWRNQGTSSSISGSGSVRVTVASNSSGEADSNATVGTGSQSLAISSTGVAWAGVIASFAPYVTINNTLAMGQGSFSLTGFDLILNYGRTMVMGVGSFSLTGFSLAFSLFQKWVNPTKNTSVETLPNKNNSTWMDKTKNISTEANQTKN